MIVYTVICDGKLSSEGYRTLEEAQGFCETRAGNQKKIGNCWRYESENNSYVIKDIRVEIEDD